MRWIVSGCGVLLALAVMGVSGVVNARYGMALAASPFDKGVMMTVAAFADAGKALSWIYFASAVARRQVLAGLASLLIFAACLTYAVTGSLGYVAMHRAQVTAGVESDGATAATLDAEIARKTAAQAALGTLEPESVIAKHLRAQRQDVRFTTSKQCTDATLEATRRFCAALAELEGQEKKAQALTALEQELAALRQRRQKLGGVATAEKGDFQSALIAQLTHVSVQTVQLRLALLFVLLVESGSCFLLWLSLNHFESLAPKAPPKPEQEQLEAKPSPRVEDLTQTVAAPAFAFGAGLSGIAPPQTFEEAPQEVAPVVAELPVVPQRRLTAGGDVPAGGGAPELEPSARQETEVQSQDGNTTAHATGGARGGVAVNGGRTGGGIDRGNGTAIGTGGGGVTAKRGRAASPGDLVVFVEECVDLAAGHSVAIAVVARAYKRWCSRRGVTALPDAMIVAGLARFCEVAGLSQEQRGAELVVTGLMLSPPRKTRRLRRVPPNTAKH